MTTVWAGHRTGELLAERISHWTRPRRALRDALSRFNFDLPSKSLTMFLKKTLNLSEPALISNNRIFHKMLADGLEMDGLDRKTGRIRGYRLVLVDYENPENNDWLVVNQFTVQEGKHTRRPDVVVFLNGLPIAVIELKNAADEQATAVKAFKQLQTYKVEIPSLFNTNEILVASDGVKTRIGSLTSGKERFAPWRTIDGLELDPKGMLSLEVMVRGLFDKERFLDYVRNFAVFEEENGVVHKKIAGYHQFHATRQAVASTLHAIRGDRRAESCGTPRVRQEPHDGLLCPEAHHGT